MIPAAEVAEIAARSRVPPRDLYDLAALAEIGAITAEAIELTHEVSGTRIDARILDQRIPPRVLEQWSFDLGHQIDKPDAPEACLRQVVDAARSAEP